jgi:hypothetical protein
MDASEVRNALRIAARILDGGERTDPADVGSGAPARSLWSECYRLLFWLGQAFWKISRCCLVAGWLIGCNRFQPINLPVGAYMPVQFTIYVYRLSAPRKVYYAIFNEAVDILNFYRDENSFCSIFDGFIFRLLPIRQWYSENCRLAYGNSKFALSGIPAYPKSVFEGVCFTRHVSNHGGIRRGEMAGILDWKKKPALSYIAFYGPSYIDVRAISEVQRVGHHSNLLFRVVRIDGGGQKSQSSKQRGQSLPTGLPLPIVMFFSAVLIAGGAYLCICALSMTESTCDARFICTVLLGWTLADCGTLLIFVRLGIW